MANTPATTSSIRIPFAPGSLSILPNRVGLHDVEDAKQNESQHQIPWPPAAQKGHEKADHLIDHDPLGIVFQGHSPRPAAGPVRNANQQDQENALLPQPELFKAKRDGQGDCRCGGTRGPGRRPSPNHEESSRAIFPELLDFQNNSFQWRVSDRGADFNKLWFSPALCCLWRTPAETQGRRELKKSRTLGVSALLREYEWRMLG